MMLREYALLGLLALLWGSSYLLIGIAVVEIPPMTLIAARVAIAAVILTMGVVASGAHWPRDRVTWGRLLLQAVFNSIGAWTLLAWGQQYVGSGLASVLNSTAPLFVFALTLSAGMNPRRLLGACVGFGGVVLIVGLEALSGIGTSIAGQLAALGGAVLYAFAAIYGRKFNHLPATVTAAGTMLWATVVLLPAAIFIDQPWRLSPSLPAILATGALGLFSTGLALLIYFRLLKTLGPLGVASQAYLRAGIAVALGAVLLGETISPAALVGILAALLGVALINSPARRK
ncbi:MAG: DMT family transporter [Pikeienuella sp.]